MAGRRERTEGGRELVSEGVREGVRVGERLTEKESIFVSVQLLQTLLANVTGQTGPGCGH